MKKVFEMIGLISLVCFSFFITEKTTTVVKNVDDIMIQIKQESKNYKIESVDAIISENTIIPGVYGQEVDIDKSYKNMKKYGSYNVELYEYKSIKPNISLEDNLDKYVIRGNSQKRTVSLIFLVKGNDNINNILKIINQNGIKATFFVDENWFSNNNDLAISLISDGHNIGNLSNNLDYQDSSFGWMDTIIKKIGNQKRGYCYYTDNIDNLNSCILLKNYTIKPTEIKNNPLLEVEKSIQSGSLLAFNIDSRLESELNSIISYIKSKGYDIVNLEEQLNEK